MSTDERQIFVHEGHGWVELTDGRFDADGMSTLDSRTAVAWDLNGVIWAFYLGDDSPPGFKVHCCVPDFSEADAALWVAFGILPSVD